MKPSDSIVLSPWGRLHDFAALPELLKQQGCPPHQNQFRLIRTQFCVGVTGGSTGNHFQADTLVVAVSSGRQVLFQREDAPFTR